MKNLNSKHVLFAVLALLMMATRFSPVAAIAHLQDASWAVFFMAGFYFSREWRWVFPALMLEAVLIDYAAIQYFGVSNYCVTAAYWFLVPSHAALWMGGSLLRRYHSMDLRGVALLLVSIVAASSVCFLISNASYYWIGSRVAEPTWNGWLSNFSTWYWPFLRSPLTYTAVGAVTHMIVIQARKYLAKHSAY